MNGIAPRRGPGNPVKGIFTELCGPPDGGPSFYIEKGPQIWSGYSLLHLCGQLSALIRLVRRHRHIQDITDIHTRLWCTETYLPANHRLDDVRLGIRKRRGTVSGQRNPAHDEIRTRDLVLLSKRRQRMHPVEAVLHLQGVHYLTFTKPIYQKKQPWGSRTPILPPGRLGVFLLGCLQG